MRGEPASQTRPRGLSDEDRAELARLLGAARAKAVAPALDDLIWWLTNGSSPVTHHHELTTGVRSEGRRLISLVAELRRRVAPFVDSLGRLEPTGNEVFVFVLADLLERDLLARNIDLRRWVAELAVIDETVAAYAGRRSALGRPTDERRPAALEVAQILAEAGVPVTTGPRGSFGRVLALVCAAADIPVSEPAIGRLVRYTVALLAPPRASVRTVQ